LWLRPLMWGHIDELTLKMVDDERVAPFVM
jgi:hypothetical protein